MNIIKMLKQRYVCEHLYAMKLTMTPLLFIGLLSEVKIYSLFCDNTRFNKIFNVSVYIDFLSAIYDFFQFVCFSYFKRLLFIFYYTLSSVMNRKTYCRFYKILSADTKNKLSLSTYLKINK